MGFLEYVRLLFLVFQEAACCLHRACTSGRPAEGHKPHKGMRSHRNTEQMRMPGAGGETERGVAILGTNPLFHRMSEFWRSVRVAVPMASDPLLCVSNQVFLPHAHTYMHAYTHTCTHTHHERTQESLEVMDMFSILEVLRV